MGVRVEMPSNQPIVLLREVSGERYLPIWIGAVEATAIAFAQQGVVPPRPLTHDLLKDVLEATGNQLDEVRITEVKDGVFFATLVFGSGAEVSARPSDSIAVALRVAARIFAQDDLLEEAAIEISEEEPSTGATLEGKGGTQAQEVMGPEELEEHLRKLNPEDFGRFTP